MNKILSLILSFSLIFTQFAPLAQAKGSSARQGKNAKAKAYTSNTPAKGSSAHRGKNKDKELERAGFVACSKKSAQISREVYQAMLTDSKSAYWRKCDNVIGFRSYWAKQHKIKDSPEVTTVLNATSYVVQDMKEVLGSEETKNFKSFVDLLSDINQEVRPFVTGTHTVMTCKKTAEGVVLCNVGSSVGKADSHGDSQHGSTSTSQTGKNKKTGASGNGLVNEQAVEDQIKKQQKVAAIDGDKLLLKNADLSYVASSTVPDIPAELKELISALNKAAQQGANMEHIMEEAIRKYLNPTYSGENAFPPSYLSLIFKLYMDNVDSLPKAWNYVTYNTPASAACKGKINDKCVDIRTFAIEGLLIQPRFRDLLTQDQWAFVQSAFEQSLARYQKKDSDQYYVELIRQGILKEGQKKVQHDLTVIVSQKLSQGKSKGEVIEETMGVLALRYLETPGPKLPGPGSFGVITRYGTFQTIEEAVAAAEAAESTAVGTEAVAGTGAGVASVAIPIAVIALFVGGFIYALNDAYGYNKPANAKRQMIDYVKRVTSQAKWEQQADKPMHNIEDAPLEQPGDYIAPINETGNPQSNGNHNQGLNQGQNVSPQPRPKKKYPQEDDVNKTCLFKKTPPIRGGLNELASRMSKQAEGKFRDLAEQCGMEKQQIHNLFATKRNKVQFAIDFFTQWFLKFEEKNQMEEDPLSEDAECEKFFDQMSELEEIKDSFYDSQTKKNLHMKIDYRTINGKTEFYAAPEISLTVRDLDNFGEVALRFGITQSQNLIYKLKQFMRGTLRDGLGESLRANSHERQIIYEKGDPTQPRNMKDLRDLGPDDYLHFHYEEIKMYDGVYTEGKKPYICNHTIIYPGEWLKK